MFLLLDVKDLRFRLRLLDVDVQEGEGISHPKGFHLIFDREGFVTTCILFLLEVVC